MSRLGITLPLLEDQSLASFCSQLASANGASNAREFCLHMGLRFQEVVDGTAESIKQLETLSGVDVLALGKAASIKHDGLYLINGEKLRKQFLCRTRFRYCPACLISDSERTDRLPEARMYGRRNWSVSFIRTCPIHHVELVTEVNPANQRVVQDFSVWIRNNKLDFRAILAGSQKRRTSNFERYITARLNNEGTSVAFLDQLPLYAAGRSCEMLGAIVHLGIGMATNSVTESQWWTCAETGYQVMSDGEDAIRDCLSSFHDRFFARACDMGGTALYGRFYEWLAHENDDVAYDPVRDLVRSHAVATLPFGPGDEIFGPITTPRRWHSVRTASLKYDVHPQRLRKLLIGAGLTEPSAIELPYSRILMDASKVETFMAASQQTLGSLDARAYVNAPRVQWRILVQEGFVRPFLEATTGGSMDLKFSVSELDRFLRAISRLSSGEPVAGKTCSIPDARRRAKCKTSELINLIIRGELLDVALDPEERGFMAVHVNISELVKKTQLEDHGGLSFREVMKELRTSTRVVSGLLNFGAIPTQLAQNRTKRCLQTFVNPVDLEAFKATFVSLSNLAIERDEHPRRIKKRLRQAGIFPAFDPEKIQASFYERTQITI
ncbi:TniQ family protein [Phyllobacterium sp. K27]